MTLIEASLRRRGVVIGLAALAMGCALAAIAGAKFDLFPEFAPPEAIVHTEAPGFPPEEVEALITRPIEESLGGTLDLQSLRSRSIPGLSVVIAEFGEGTDLHAARQQVNDRLARIAGDLPAGAESPVLAPLTGRGNLVLGIGLTAEKRLPMDLRTFADRSVRPGLLAVPGIASVVEFGGEVRQVQVQIRPAALARHGLSLPQVVEAVRQATGVLGSGFIETANQRVLLRVDGQPRTAAELGECLAAPGIRLKDVAEVVEAPEPKSGDAAINGEPGVLLLAWGQVGEDTIELTRALESVLEEMRPLLEREGIQLHPDLFRPASDLEAALRNVRLSFLAGAGLVLLVLAVFSFNLRSALVSLSALLLSLVLAAGALEAAGFTLDAITLAGFVLAIGELASDAVLPVAGVQRRRREQEKAGSPLSALEVVGDAAREVRGAVFPGALVGPLAFVPIVALTGEGKLLAPLGLAYVAAIVASLLVASTVTPALCLTLLARNPAAPPAAHRRWPGSVYERLLAAFLRRPGRALAFTVGVCAVAAAALPFFACRFLPELRESHLLVAMSMAPGTSVIESMRLGREVGQRLRAQPHIRSVAMRVGRADLAHGTAGAESSEFILALGSPQGLTAEAAAVHGLLADIPGCRFAVTPCRKGGSEEAGAEDRAKVRLYGDDLDVLEGTAREVDRVLKSIPGSVAFRSSPPRGPRLVVRLRPEKLQQLGFHPRDLLDTVRTGFQGTVAAQVHDQNRVTAVVVILDEEHRRDPEAVGSLTVQAASGAWVPLREVADVFLSTGRESVLHEGLRRYAEVSCRVQGRSVPSFIREAESRIRSEVKFPPEVKPVFAGGATGRAPSPEALACSAAATVAMVLFLAAALGSARRLILLLALVPFAFAGGALALLLAGGSLSLGSLLAFVGISGITARHALVVLARWGRLPAVEGQPASPETLARGTAEASVPLFLAAAVAGSLLLPLALQGDKPGGEIVAPMAITLLGGLVASTVLQLFVLPAFVFRRGTLDGRVP